MRKAPTTVIRQTISSTMIITSFMWTLPMAPDPFFTGCSTAAWPWPRRSGRSSGKKVAHAPLGHNEPGGGGVVFNFFPQDGGRPRPRPARRPHSPRNSKRAPSGPPGRTPFRAGRPKSQMRSYSRWVRSRGWPSLLTVARERIDGHPAQAQGVPVGLCRRGGLLIGVDGHGHPADVGLHPGTAAPAQRRGLVI